MPINESAVWEPEVREVATGDPVAGGPTGPVNLSLQDLANRTQYLKAFAQDILDDLNAIALLVGDTSMDDVLLKANNLSDVPNKELARANLNVSSADHAHGAYMSKSANLADVENPLTGRQNLGVSDILFGTGAPTSGTGKNGDIYIRTDLDHVSIYKKSAGVWAVAITNTNIPGNAATATLAALATLAQACSGNSATADRLKTARNINGVSFSGMEDITIYDDTKTKLPTTSAGVGQFINIQATSVNYTLPYGGTWVYWVIGVRPSYGDVNSCKVGIVAGGSIITGWSSNYPYGFAWRIA